MSYMKLFGKTEQLVVDELAEANKNNPLFRSVHEGYAVLLEEYEEAVEELEQVKIYLSEAWSGIKNNESLKTIKNISSGIEKDAINLACEAIQVAAMARKMQIHCKEEEK